MQPTRRTATLRHVHVSTWLVLGIGLIGAGLSLAVYRYNVRLRAARIETEFSRRVETRTALTRETLNYYVSGIYALRSLFQGSSYVQPAEFRVVATEILARVPGIAALEWVPRVAGQDRAVFEKSFSEKLGRPFEFTQPRGPNDRTMVRAPERPEYFPILYVEPFAGNEAALGYDIQDAPSRPFLDRARQSGELVVTSPFETVQGRRGLVMSCPVYFIEPGQDVGRRFRGFVQGVFWVDAMLAQTQQHGPTNAADILYVDDSATDPAQRILHFAPAQGSASAGSDVSEESFRRGLHRVMPIEFGGRRWLALCRPSAEWLREQENRFAEWWLGAGLLITALVAGLVLALARRTSAIARLVAERTAELEESRRQLDNLFAALPGMAFRARYDDRLEVFFASEGALALTGWPASDFAEGQVHFQDLVHPNDLEILRHGTQRAVIERKGFESEYRLITANGREKWVFTRARGVYSESGELLFFEGLAIDITARKQAEIEKFGLERKLLETQKLESLGLLAGGIAHDFNNLLTGILGHASLARHRDNSDPEVVDHLRKIEAGAMRAADLCQQMLAYSGRGRFLLESLDLSALVRDTLPLLRGALSPRAGLELALSEEPIPITADATQIRQIVMNLIMNAGEALGAASGSIHVRTARASLGREFLAAARVGDNLPAGDYAVLEVRDSGCGMSHDTLAKIFDPFFTTKFTGRGLGLAAVLGIVRGHSGALRVESELGVGSTFTLVLPLGAGDAMTARTATATPWQRKGMVLVIDDEEPVREIAAELIRTFGFSVVTAPDGATGLERYRADPSAFDLVFLDLTMPGLGGEETLAGLRQINPLVRVMLVSGYSENDRVALLASHGPLTFMQKPFTRARLEQKLRELLG